MSRAGERPGRPVDVLPLVARAADHQQPAARLDQIGQSLARVGQNVRRQGLQRIGFMDQVEGAAPFRRRREQVGGAKFDAAVRKAVLRPFRGARHEIESGDRGALLRQGGGVVAEPASDIER